MRSRNARNRESTRLPFLLPTLAIGFQGTVEGFERRTGVVFVEGIQRILGIILVDGVERIVRVVLVDRIRRVTGIVLIDGI